MLPAPVVAMFDEIRKGPLFPHAWLATGEARVRTVRLSGFNMQQEKLFVSSHRRHDKVDQVKASAEGEFCLVDLAGPIQLRFRCALRFLDEAGEAPLRESFWRRVPDDNRWRLYGCEPTRLVPPPDFIVLEGSVLEVDLLDHRPEYPVRKGYLRKDSLEWVEETRIV